jgi:hypothetical protein
MQVSKPKLDVRAFYCEQYCNQIKLVKSSLEAVMLSYIAVERKYGKQKTHELIEWHNFNTNN